MVALQPGLFEAVFSQFFTEMVQWLFETVLKSQPWLALAMLTNRDFSIKQLLGNAAIIDADKVARLTKMRSKDDALNTRQLASLNYCIVWCKWQPFHPQDPSKTCLIKSFKGFEMSPVHNPGLTGIQKSRENTSLLYTRLGRGFNTVLAPNTSLKQTVVT